MNERPAVTPLRVRSDARLQPVDLKFAALKQLGLLIGFCLRFSLVSGHGSRGSGSKLVTLMSGMHKLSFLNDL
jgi:hypothetical protein